jgi:hypothetical protein
MAADASLAGVAYLGGRSSSGVGTLAIVLSMFTAPLLHVRQDNARSAGISLALRAALPVGMVIAVAEASNLSGKDSDLAFEHADRAFWVTMAVAMVVDWTLLSRRVRHAPDAPAKTARMWMPSLTQQGDATMLGAVGTF